MMQLPAFTTEHTKCAPDESNEYVYLMSKYSVECDTESCDRGPLADGALLVVDESGGTLHHPTILDGQHLITCDQALSYLAGGGDVVYKGNSLTNITSEDSLSRSSDGFLPGGKDIYVTGMGDWYADQIA